MLNAWSYGTPVIYAWLFIKARPFILENYQISNFTFLANFQHFFGTAVLNTFWLYALDYFLYWIRCIETFVEHSLSRYTGGSIMRVLHRTLAFKTFVFCKSFLNNLNYFSLITSKSFFMSNEQINLTFTAKIFLIDVNSLMSILNWFSLLLYESLTKKCQSHLKIITSSAWEMCTNFRTFKSEHPVVNEIIS